MADRFKLSEKDYGSRVSQIGRLTRLRQDIDQRNLSPARLAVYDETLMAFALAVRDADNLDQFDKLYRQIKKLRAIDSPAASLVAECADARELYGIWSPKMDEVRERISSLFLNIRDSKDTLLDTTSPLRRLKDTVDRAFQAGMIDSDRIKSYDAMFASTEAMRAKTQGIALSPEEGIEYDYVRRKNTFAEFQRAVSAVAAFDPLAALRVLYSVQRTGRFDKEPPRDETKAFEASLARSIAARAGMLLRNPGAADEFYSMLCQEVIASLSYGPYTMAPFVEAMETAATQGIRPSEALRRVQDLPSASHWSGDKVVMLERARQILQPISSLEI